MRTARLELTEAGLATAAGLLRAGGLVAFPTETVYGLGADACSDQAVARIYAAKERPRFNPLIIHVADAERAFAEAAPSDLAETLAARFWPGPLTLVLPRRPASRISLLAGAGLDTLALRVPGEATARALLKAAGLPIAAPSANRSGRVSPTAPAHVAEELDGRIDAILWGDPCAVGLESTVLDLSGPRPLLLRHGGLPRAVLEDVTGPLALAAADGPVRAPGATLAHYAPRLPLRIDARAPRTGEALLAFGPSPPEAPLVWTLSARGDLAEAAARLFAGLRYLDREGPAAGCSGIAVMPLPETGLGEAINDRLRRAVAAQPERSAPVSPPQAGA